MDIENMDFIIIENGKIPDLGIGSNLRPMGAADGLVYV